MTCSGLHSSELCCYNYVNCVCLHQMKLAGAYTVFGVSSSPSMQGPAQEDWCEAT